MRYTAWFDEIRKDGVALGGGKGANLGELSHAGLPVPPGFVVTTRAYDAFVEAGGLKDEIVGLASRANDPGELEAAAQKIQALFARSTIPEDVAAEVRDAYTRLANADATHRRVEIGWTWIARPWQRTAINTEAKYLMLRHAFEALGCLRVELKTDALNQRSRNAILRIGAREEGVLRKHMITEGGRVRDTVYFSVTDDEWPAVKARLEQMLAAGVSHPNDR